MLILIAPYKKNKDNCLRVIKKLLIRITFTFLLLSLCTISAAQFKNYSTKNAYSHNNYLNPTPFYLAFKNEFDSIEADVFSVKGIIYVAHQKEEIQLKNTLKNLYLTQIFHEFISNQTRKLILLIDVKDNYKITLPFFIKEIEPLQKILSTLERPNQLTNIISGTRPPPNEYNYYYHCIFFDDDLKLFSPVEWERVGLVSLPFNKITDWKGEGVINRKEKKKLRHSSDSVHATG